LQGLQLSLALSLAPSIDVNLLAGKISSEQQYEERVLIEIQSGRTSKEVVFFIPGYVLEGGLVEVEQYIDMYICIYM